MKKLTIFIGILFLATSAFAGLLNKSENIIDFVNNLESKAGYIWLSEVKELRGEYVPQFSGSLYTFEEKDSKLRLGSIDLGYIGGTHKFLLETMLDSNILKTFSIPMLGEVGLSAGMGLGLDFDKVEDGYKITKDDWVWGIPTIGFKFKI